MRRRAKATERPFKYFDVRKEIQPERLQALGAVMLAWNWIEGAIDTALNCALELHPDMWVEVTSRINGLNGKIAILKASAKLFPGTPADMLLAISKTLNAIENHKKYRDGVAHARVFHPEADVVDTAQRKGMTDEVLINRDALEALYDRLRVLQLESDQMTGFFYYRWLGTTTKSAETKQSAAQELQACMARLPEHQRTREQLPPLPKFPDELQAPSATEGVQALPG